MFWKSIGLSHAFIFSILKMMRYIPFSRGLLGWICRYQKNNLSNDYFGVKFKNPLGFAAGLDRKGRYVDDLSLFGCGFVEIGPVKNITKVVRELKKNPPKDETLLISLGGRHGENYLADIERDFTLAYDFGDAICVTALKESYKEMLDRIFTARRYNDNYKPVIVRISPLFEIKEVPEVIHYALSSGADAVEAPGIFVDEILTVVNNAVPVIAVTVLKNVDEAKALFDKGVSLIAISGGLIEHGPFYFKKILKTL